MVETTGLLQLPCHTAIPQMHKGELCFEVDGSLLISWDEMQGLINGLYTVEELKDLHSVAYSN